MPFELAGKRVLVAGMAKSGFAAASLLRSHGARVRAIDARPTDEMRARLDADGIPLGLQTPAAFFDADLIVLSPGVPVEAVPENAPPVIGELELASYDMRGPSIGITGTNGKTTTTSLIGHVLKHAGIACQVGGNIGTPPAAMVATSRDDQWNVLELSSFQLETIREFHARIALVLNITQNHLDRHIEMPRYIAAKARLLDTQRPDGVAILNRDDQNAASLAARARGRVEWFGMQPAHDGWWFADERIACTEGVLMRAGEIRLKGLHNVANVMAAAAACRIAGATLDQIRAAVMTFEGVEHRIEFVRRVREVDYYNDSKATSVDAAVNSIRAFSGGLWVIMGGKDKGSDYTVMRPLLAERARGVLLIGAASAKIEEQLAGAVETVACGELARAVQAGYDRARAGDTVLLAPACASFDQFRSYEHRGDEFKRLVREIGG